MFNGGREFDLIVVLFILLVIVGVGYTGNGGY
ncbi:YjcZ family sporulation protein [Virgibacillus sp. 179-BFC.A HS]|uniref:YjcZ family sporulation protein n=1 Tax=Tigheibacillus jepli TaxID=3035914 RepID=A0ABU5CM60_9BACI|nr:YjcZ family sporulation protein [Virgibacillus sp. 179-BFC.A HS]MDY0406540.1 YjcZ family sporulation protein [Virgibacillus sp. 179-BFC.A HS]